MVDIVGVDEHQLVGQTVRIVRIEVAEAGDLSDQVALTVDHHHRPLILECCLQVFQDQRLQKLRLTVTRAAEHVGVFKPDREGDAGFCFDHDLSEHGRKERLAEEFFVREHPDHHDAV